MLSGAIWVAKGGLIIFGVVDLGDWLIAAELFFALALVALYLRLGDHRGRSGRLGGLLAYVAVALSAVNAPYSLFFAEDRPQAPFPFNVTIFMASLAIVVGLILLGTATLQAGILPAGWRSLPLVVGALAGVGSGIRPPRTPDRGSRFRLDVAGVRSVVRCWCVSPAKISLELGRCRVANPRRHHAPCFRGD